MQGACPETLMSYLQTGWGVADHWMPLDSVAVSPSVGFQTAVVTSCLAEKPGRHAVALSQVHHL